MNTNLNRKVKEMMDFIYSLSSEVRIEHIHTIYEDEDANLRLYPPLTWTEEQCLDLQHDIAEHVSDLLVDSGYLILVYVYTPEEQIALARSKLTESHRKIVLAQQQSAQAHQFLTQAAAIGLS